PLQGQGGAPFEAPKSPDAASIVMPCDVAARRTACCSRCKCEAIHTSASPKLIETTDPMWCSTTNRSVLIWSGSVSLGARARTMLAPGAIACAHSTSTAISCDQPNWSSLLGLKGVSPKGASVVQLGVAGRWNADWT